MTTGSQITTSSTTRTRRSIRAVACVTAAACAWMAASAPGSAGETRSEVAAAHTTGGQSSGAVPWAQVGRGWTVILVAPASGPARYHLASPGGLLYATGVEAPVAGPGGARYDGILDVSDAGHHVLVSAQVETGGESSERVASLDLRSGTLRVISVAASSGERLVRGHYRGASALRYVSTSVGMSNEYAVTAVGDGTTRTLYRDQVTQPHPWGPLDGDRVLPTNDGKATILGAGDRLRRVDNVTGRLQYSWPTPSPFYRSCEPRRWWSESTMVASCTSASGKSSIYLQGPTGASTRLTAFAGRQGGGIRDAWYRKAGSVILDVPATSSGTTVLRRLTSGFPAVVTGYPRSSTTPLTVVGDHYFATVATDSGTVVIRNDLSTGVTQTIAADGPAGTIAAAHTINPRD